MSFGRASAIADAVLFEGYVLYPYRASSTKNRFRWAFGVLAPRAWGEAGGEPCWMETQLLVEGDASARIDGRLRFLRVRRRTVEARRAGGFAEVAELEVDGRLHLPWEEGEICEVDFSAPLGGEAAFPFGLEGGEEIEPLLRADGTPAGRIVRRWLPLSGEVRVAAEAIPAERPLARLRVRAENATPFHEPAARRDDAMAASCIGAHLLLAAEGAAFCSALDPPAWARAAAAACRSERAFPVLVGERGRRDVVLAAPIVLYDHPEIAPESGGDFFDATEIDELLALRTSLLTDAEKREARATDDRAAAILERVEGMRAPEWERLHGAFRSVEGGEMVPRALPVGVGSRVRLCPGARRTDAQDVLYAGCTATVEEVRRDVDGRDWLAVTIDGDPAAELHRWYGRFHYFLPDEVEAL